MPFSAISPSRLKRLNELNIRNGRFVLYWMQQSQRAEDNHALEYAVQEANRIGQGVLVAFGLTKDYPGANGLSTEAVVECADSGFAITGWTDDKDYFLFRTDSLGDSL